MIKLVMIIIIEVLIIGYGGIELLKHKEIKPMKEMESVRDVIIRHEGSVKKRGVHVPYKCPANKTTIGYGRNLEDRGITEQEAQVLLTNDIDLCRLDLIDIFGPGLACSIPHGVWTALIDMRFALGGGGFRKFRGVIRQVKAKNKEGVIREMKDSHWYRTFGKNRIDDLASIIREDKGEWV